MPLLRPETLGCILVIDRYSPKYCLPARLDALDTSLVYYPARVQ
jgi:hypothetical protein